MNKPAKEKKTKVDLENLEAFCQLHFHYNPNLDYKFTLEEKKKRLEAKQLKAKNPEPTEQEA